MPPVRSSTSRAEEAKASNPSPYLSTPAAPVSTSSSGTLPLQSPAFSDRRLFVGNLAPSVTEYDLLILFQSHGKITKLDLVFHRTGSDRGKPKGFAFVELATPLEAIRAKSLLEGKLVKGREIRLRFATAENVEHNDAVAAEHRNRAPQSRPGQSRGHPAAKSAMRNESRGTREKDKDVDDRIAAMEAKLEAMRQSKKTASTSADTHEATSMSLASPSLRGHASLPAKPPQGSRRN